MLHLPIFLVVSSEYFLHSPSGDLLAYASTDLTIGLLDAKTLTVC